MVETAATVDPVTFEVLVNRLRMINESAGTIGKRVSGSQIVYECGDYNCTIMDASGGALFVGPYNTMVGSSIDLGAQWIIEKCSDNPGIHPGDVFYHNDPWIGTLHQQDCVGLAPIFVGDQLVCWMGMAIHEADVGGAVPGSFGIGVSDSYAESTIIPPVKIVEGGVFRSDVERSILRNSRTPDLLALDLRARLAAFRYADNAVQEIAQKYGIDTLMAVLRDIRSVVGARLRERLDGIPDGRWRSVMYWDHDGTTDATYRGELTLTKVGPELTFDFTGSAEQTPGLINCTRVGLQGAVNLVLLATLCFDLPWTTSEFRSIARIEVPDGTLFSAVSPAPVSGATGGCVHLAANLVQACVSEMLLGSEALRNEAMAVWQPAWTGAFFNGVDHDGKPFTGGIMDGFLGGEGACCHRDGQDAGGLLIAANVELANVERNESSLPILQLSRRMQSDSCGHGRYRGGSGTSIMWTPHKTSAPLNEVLYSSYFEQLVAGLRGGYGPAVMTHRIGRKTDLQHQFEAGVVPIDIDELRSEQLEDLPCKGIAVLNDSDVHLMTVTGGGGYGDVLKRDPEMVRRDVERGTYGLATAQRIYGVVLGAGGTVDHAATVAARKQITAERRQGGQLVADLVAGNPAPRVPGAGIRNCDECGYQLSDGSFDPRRSTLTRLRASIDLSPLNASAGTEYVVWEFHCPRCATLIDTEVLLSADPLDIALWQG